MNITNIADIVKKLEESPVYCLTNSSMENSHTDFWSWVIKELGVEGLKIFGVTPLQDEKLSKVKREWNHFDLYIETNKRCIVIENKIKSIHTNEQLREYSGKINKICKGSDGTIQILATFFEEPNGIPEEWGLISYADILKNLQNIKTENIFIKEYTGVLEKLNKLVNEFRDSESIYEIESSENVEYANLLKTLESARLDDIYKKFKMIQLKKYLTEKLGANYSMETYFVSGQGGLSLDIEYIRGVDKKPEDADKKSIRFRITLHGIRYVKEVLIGTKTNFYLDNSKVLLSDSDCSSILDKINWLKIKEDEVSSMRHSDEYNTFGKKGQYHHLSKYRHFDIQKTYGKSRISYADLFERIKTDINSLYLEIEKTNFDGIFSAVK